MIVAIEPVAAPRLGFTCDVTPIDLNGNHVRHETVAAAVIVRLKLTDVGTIAVPMCTGCLRELVESIQDGDGVIKVGIGADSADESDW